MVPAKLQMRHQWAAMSLYRPSRRQPQPRRCLRRVTMFPLATASAQAATPGEWFIMLKPQITTTPPTMQVLVGNQVDIN